MKAAIYCRVSTDNQESEGTSLQTQLEACLKYCRDKDNEVSHRFSEAYSGLTLDRPKLNDLRELVRDEQIDVVVVYCLDRLSRDPTHGVILTQELEKHNITLESVTETVESTELGKLISYVRGFASKLEAQKIRERTMRGRKARAQGGRLPAVGRLYGYTYLPGKGQGEGIRYINEEPTKWVREMYRWLVEENLSTDQITYRLREFNVTTPSGKGWWLRSTVCKILKNPSYYGETNVFTRTYGEPGYKVKDRTKRKNTGVIWKPRKEWINIPGATPAIISEELFNEAQKCLTQNKRLSVKNNKHDYLLRGHVFCARCGRTYSGEQGVKLRNGKRYHYPYYGCIGKRKRITPIPCDNKQHATTRLEDLVWVEVEKVLSQPDIIISELERAREGHDERVLEKELERINAVFDNRNKQKDRTWKAFTITGDEVKFKKEIFEIDKELKELKAQINDTEKQIAANEELVLNAGSIEETCAALSRKIKSLDFDDKKLAIQALQIRVLVDGNSITI
ncbi:recombinase family protein, partial [Chloroflexota bacterium]